MNIGIVNGPNLNMLGKREESFYGAFSLQQLEDYLIQEVPSEINLSFFQSNSESEIVDYIQNSYENKLDALVVNAAAYTHTSIAIRDALLAVPMSFIEVHISNIYKREEFRHKSFLNDIAIGTISGLGKDSYLLAIFYLIRNQPSVS